MIATAGNHSLYEEDTHLRFDRRSRRIRGKPSPRRSSPPKHLRGKAPSGLGGMHRRRDKRNYL